MSLLLQTHLNAKSLSQNNRRYPQKSIKRAKTLWKEGTWKISFFHCGRGTSLRNGIRRIAGCLPKKGERASLTLEASLSLTLLLIVMASLCQAFVIMELQLHLQRALEQVANEAAGYRYVSSQIPLWESESRLLGEIQEYLLTELSEEALRLRFVSVAGEEYLAQSPVEGEVSFAGSSLRSEDCRIRLTLSYQIRLPVALVGIPSVTLCQQSYRYAWLGDAQPEKAAGQEELEEPMVYVTQNSHVYHLSLSCTHLKLSVRAVAPETVEALRNENGAKYYACELCRPDGQESTLYVAKEGNRYHGSRECGGISRKVTAIPLSEAAGRRPCSRCGGEE